MSNMAMEWKLDRKYVKDMEASIAYDAPWIHFNSYIYINNIYMYRINETRFSHLLPISPSAL